MGYKEIAGLNPVQLKERQASVQKELVLLRFDKASGKVLDTSVPKKKRKELAQVLTRMSEIERNS